MKKTILVTAGLFAASLAFAGDAYKHKNSRTTTTSEQTTSLTGGSVDREHTRIEDMNQYRYSKTFGVHGLRGSESATAEASDRFNPNWGRKTTTTTTRTTTGAATTRDTSSADLDSAEADTSEMESAEREETSESTSMTGAGTAATTSDAKKADDQASKGDRDLEITRQIRQEIMGNDNLSVRAQNLNIVTENGRVSIRGTVNSDSEKSSVEQIARGVSGVTSVDNQITVSR